MDWICGFLTGSIAGCILGLVLAPCRKETAVVVTSTPRWGGVLRMDWSRCEFPGPPDGWNPADPDVLPLGSAVYIEGVGLRYIQDTGSAVKGKALDVAVDTHSEALTWSGCLRLSK